MNIINQNPRFLIHNHFSNPIKNSTKSKILIGIISGTIFFWEGLTFFRIRMGATNKDKKKEKRKRFAYALAKNTSVVLKQYPCFYPIMYGVKITADEYIGNFKEEIWL